MTSVVDIARSQLGVQETTGRNDGVPADRYAFGEEVPWCAAFVAWCFREAGTPLPGNRWHLRSVAYLESGLRARGAKVADPRPGDIVVFRSRMQSDVAPWGNHVGIVEVAADRRIRTIEGNTANAVRRRAYAVKDPRITGFFRWPLEARP